MSAETASRHPCAEQISAIEAWFGEPDADRGPSHVARLVLRPHDLAGAPLMVEALVAEAREAMLGAGRRRNEPWPSLNVAAYATLTMRRMVPKLLDLGRPKRVSLWDDPDDEDLTNHYLARTAELVERSERLGTTGDALRAAMEPLAPEGPNDGWVLGAALTFLTVRLDAAPLPTGVPVPKTGATEEQAALWPALWFAGRRDGYFDHCAGEVSPDAVRRRRQRAGKRVLALFEGACMVQHPDLVARRKALAEPLASNVARSAQTRGVGSTRRGGRRG
ncbi:hypothetical protein [Rhabdothermincola salaria]|uniref:hypothetical protein n=1 Tax=Rhabdothermincola salaria TaxID=2903142 RepID=UPI001E2D4FC3|nr:hypothetical protein [Rhabdothermincola salaria]MCD9624205.1 hypothetical protein [Rhabdothermincola salaria]